MKGPGGVQKERDLLKGQYVRLKAENHPEGLMGIFHPMAIPPLMDIVCGCFEYIICPLRFFETFA
jgi:hypothetical protein